MFRTTSHEFAAELRAQLLAAQDDVWAAHTAGDEMREQLAHDRIRDLRALAERNGIMIDGSEWARSRRR